MNYAPSKNRKSSITRLAKYKLIKINRCHSILLSLIKVHFHKVRLAVVQIQKKCEKPKITLKNYFFTNKVADSH